MCVSEPSTWRCAVQDGRLTAARTRRCNIECTRVSQGRVCSCLRGRTMSAHCMSIWGPDSIFQKKKVFNLAQMLLHQLSRLFLPATDPTPTCRGSPSTASETAGKTTLGDTSALNVGTDVPRCAERPSADHRGYHKYKCCACCCTLLRKVAHEVFFCMICQSSSQLEVLPQLQ